MTFPRVTLYRPPMRVLGLLVLLVVGLGFGIAPKPASAEPCPLHAQHHGAMAGQETGGTEGTTAPAVPVETVAIAAPAQPDAAPAPHPVHDHAVPEGQSCCHAAATAAPAVWPVLAPRAPPGRRPVPRSWLPPWAVPSDGIYRPPAAA